MAGDSDRNQRGLQVSSFFEIDISESRSYEALTSLQRAAMPSIVGEGSLASPITISDDYSDDEATVTSILAPVVLNEDTATPSPPIRGGTCRFRGHALAVIGQLFPNAHFEIHRIGYPKEFDFTPVGSELAAMHALIDTGAVFRVTMTQCDTPSESDEPLFWSKRLSVPNGLTADEYCNILKLGQPSLGKIILFTYCTKQNHSWGLARQVPGRNYTLEDCFNTIQVPHELRSEIQDFGAKLWTIGQKMPSPYICKDMPLASVTTKINNIMRD